MARPNDLIAKTDFTIRMHPEHSCVLEKLVVWWSMWAWSVAELTSRIVSTVLSQNGKIDISDEMRRILGESRKTD